MKHPKKETSHEKTNKIFDSSHNLKRSRSGSVENKKS